MNPGGEHLSSSEIDYKVSIEIQIKFNKYVNLFFFSLDCLLYYESFLDLSISYMDI